ncbi:T9SS type A sorting domain-containing protein [Flavobacterium sp. Sr18]|uniref:zinc-dependent metalloprotease n=1 Tax=Flavobacterium sp. Sr18 TaxID=935222 RepID=UPI0013E4A806|nr:zinc-dependent metalloprotease [Flavobacterium sp. Sr18]QIH40003.1 T9SS type A sorting domain-containing protein [Flavobacterium sp. Sr18]
MKKLLLLTTILLSIGSSIGQTSPWTVMTQSQIALLPVYPPSTGFMPYDYEVFTLDLALLATQLSDAPMDSATNSNVILKFPNPEGGQDDYKIFEVSVMEQALQNNFPNNKSYIGKSIKDKTQTIRFSLTTIGFDAVTYSGKVDSFFIKKYRSNLFSTYIIYKHSQSAINPVYRNSIPSSIKTDFVCGVENISKKIINNKAHQQHKSNQINTVDKLRVFRLAIATTVEFSSKIIDQLGMNASTTSQKKSAIIAGLVQLVTRLNCDWERDLSVRMKLVANQELLIFIETDNFTNGNMYTLIDESTQITPIIGNINFDIGLVLGTGGGGIASQGILQDNQKTRVVAEYGTEGITGAVFVNSITHEMGHFFGANHTYSASDCQNVSGSSQIEPYAGVTIMSYNRKCSSLQPTNVASLFDVWQPVNDPFYHSESIKEMQNLLSQATSGTYILLNSTPPVVNAGLDYTIPKDTPYMLKATVSNSNSDGYTYSWENTDTGIQAETSATATTGPNFKFFKPTNEPIRYMPKLAKVLTGNLSSKNERLSSVSRIQNFTVIVRDNSMIQGSHIRRDDMKLTVNADAGPFEVISQNSAGITWAGNSSQTITWNVAGTTANNINTSLVNILLSTDKGLTFTTTLLANTPNDGTQIISVPNNINALDCRLMVQSVGNLFYAVNTIKFAIAPNLATNDFEFENFVLYPNPNNGSFKISFKPETNDEIKITIYDVSGKNIYNKTFQNSGMFDQESQIKTASSGVYFVNIQNGENKMVKRILVE